MSERGRKSEYEAERERNVERNRRILASLGLAGVSLATLKKGVCGQSHKTENKSLPSKAKETEIQPSAQVFVCERERKRENDEKWEDIVR